MGGAGVDKEQGRELLPSEALIPAQNPPCDGGLT